MNFIQKMITIQTTMSLNKASSNLPSPVIPNTCLQDIVDKVLELKKRLEELNVPYFKDCKSEGEAVINSLLTWYLNATSTMETILSNKIKYDNTPTITKNSIREHSSLLKHLLTQRNSEPTFLFYKN